MAEFTVDKQLLRQAFGTASGHYDDFAQLQRSVAYDLLQLSQLQNLYGNVLDLGCGTGFLTRLVQERYPSARLVGMDIALMMLNKAQSKWAANTRWLCADAEKLPLQKNSFDAVFSNLMLQWCVNVPQVLNECRRVLRQGGQLAISTFGPQTLCELKQAWAQVDDYRHVNDFQLAEQLQSLLEQHGWKNCRIEQCLHQLEYPTVLDLMKELKGLGAHNVAAERNKNLTGKAKLQKLIDNYPPASHSQNIIASYEVIWVFAEADK